MKKLSLFLLYLISAVSLRAEFIGGITFKIKLPQDSRWGVYLPLQVSSTSGLKLNEQVEAFSEMKSPAIQTFAQLAQKDVDPINKKLKSAKLTHTKAKLNTELAPLQKTLDAANRHFSNYSVGAQTLFDTTTKFETRAMMTSSFVTDQPVHTDQLSCDYMSYRGPVAVINKMDVSSPVVNNFQMCPYSKATSPVVTSLSTAENGNLKSFAMLPFNTTFISESKRSALQTWWSVATVDRLNSGLTDALQEAATVNSPLIGEASVFQIAFFPDASTMSDGASTYVKALGNYQSRVKAYYPAENWVEGKFLADSKQVNANKIVSYCSMQKLFSVVDLTAVQLKLFNNSDIANTTFSYWDKGSFIVYLDLTHQVSMNHADQTIPNGAQSEMW